MNEQIFQPDALILANGDYPSHPCPLQLMEEAPIVVCCDGGADEYIAHGHLPHLIIGDGDSLSEANREKYAHLLHHNPDQETNDQTKAISYLLEHGYKKIAIVGATGKREDHTIGNISLLMEYMRQGAEVRMFTDYGVFIPCRNRITLPSTPGQALSIFNFTANGFRSEGLKYPIYDFTTWWQGTLNSCTNHNLCIEAQGEFLVFINYFPTFTPSKQQK